MGAGQLDVKNLTVSAGQRVVLQGLSFSVNKGEVLFIKGPSGVGKSLLLRALAHLDRPAAGTVLLDGRPPAELGIPCWRARVMYVLQARVPLKGSPTEFYFQAQQLGSQRGRPRGDLPSLVHNLGLEQVVLNQPWSELSGGQAQRVMLAIATALRPDVLLLDEPTSACDPVSTRMVESTLRSAGITTLWVSHDPEQPSRVGGRVMELPLCTITSLPPPPQQAPSSPVYHSNNNGDQHGSPHRVEVRVDSR